MSDDPDYLFALKLQQQLNESEDSGMSQNSQANKNTNINAGINDMDFARMLQSQLDAEDAADGSANDTIICEASGSNAFVTRKNLKETMKKSGGSDANFLDQTQNLVHPEWELVDPTPDVHVMFGRFNEKFFKNRLGAVCVEWSKRMYSCAGICYQRSNGYLKEIIIRLSEPLLKLRPRKDLVETLLHEMIHAYCFVMNIIEGNGGHGPVFKRIMGTINTVAGTNITVYHTFHDEVNLYKTHIWRCTGICQVRPPFYGWVKRTSNRAPGPSDQWWSKHQSDCSGTFHKVSQPEKSKAKPEKPERTLKGRHNKDNEAKSVRDAAGGSGDIRNFFGNPNRPKSATGPPSATVTSGLANLMPPTSYPGLSSNPMAGIGSRRRNINGTANIVGIQSLIIPDSSPRRDQPTTALNEMHGQGYTMSKGSGQSDEVTPQQMRETRLKLFDKNDNTKQGNHLPDTKNPSKRRRISSKDNENPIHHWESYEDDVQLCVMDKPVVVEISDSDDDDDKNLPKSTPKMSGQELSVIIKREVLEDEDGFTDNEITMIDDEYNDNANDLTAAAELADQSIMDDLFGEDTLLKEFQGQNDLVMPGSRRYQSDPANDITSCPICMEQMKRSEFDNHLEGCSYTVKIVPPFLKRKANLKTANTSVNMAKNRRGNRDDLRNALKRIGYSNTDVDNLNLNTSSSSNGSDKDVYETESPRQARQRGILKPTTQCPKCGRELLSYQIKAHRNICKS